MKEFMIDIEIAASQKRVWDALVDFENYGKWNPIVSFGKGTFEANGYLQLTAMISRDKRSEFRVNVESVEATRKFILSRSIVHPKLAHLVHHFELEMVAEEKTLFTQRWECTGLLIPLLWKKLTAGMGKFEKFNLGLKDYLEGMDI